MKRICILGSTGSIGTQALTVCDGLGYEVVGLAAGSNAFALAEQAKKYRPEQVCIFEESHYQELKDLLRNTNIKVTSGLAGLCEMAACDCDIVLNSVVGMIGLEPTLAAIEAGNAVALANKETLVTGGKLVMEAARKQGVPILPVDSEHSAIFQCLRGNRPSQVKKLILTASGGPFFGKTRGELADVTPEQALHHPNWSMGAKVTVDSATLMNKGLELMEACWLFDKEPDEVEIVVHRESIVHSLVEYDDNAVIAQLGLPDMRIPIQYALTYPERFPSPVGSLSLAECRTLTFARPDVETFECLAACAEAIRRGGLYPAIVNGADEEAVRLFLERKIGFLDIGRLVAGSLALDGRSECFGISEIQAADRMARQYVLSQLKA